MMSELTATCMRHVFSVLRDTIPSSSSASPSYRLSQRCVQVLATPRVRQIFSHLQHSATSPVYDDRAPGNPPHRSGRLYRVVSVVSVGVGRVGGLCLCWSCRSGQSFFFLLCWLGRVGLVEQGGQAFRLCRTSRSCPEAPKTRALARKR